MKLKFDVANPVPKDMIVLFPSSQISPSHSRSGLD